MQEQLIIFETAKLAKEKGFNFKVLKQYSPDYEGVIDTDHSANCVIGGECALKYPDKDCFGAPTQSLLQKWLRDEHRISVCVDFRHSKTYKIEGINSVYYDVNIYTLSGGDAFKTIKLSQIRDNYEEALEMGLQEALKLIKK